MKNKKVFVGNFLICAIMISFGLAFDREKDRGFLSFMVFMAFVTLLFFLVQIGRLNIKRHLKTFLFFLAALAEMMWLGWIGVTLNRRFTLGFIGTVCIAWFLISFFCVYLHQRRVVSRWNAAYAAWKSGGGAEDYLKEIEQCEAELKNDEGISIVYSGVPLNDYILVHKIFLLKEMGEDRECLALLKSIRPRIRNPEMQKALSETETELSEKFQ